MKNNIEVSGNSSHGTRTYNSTEVSENSKGAGHTKIVLQSIETVVTVTQ